MRDIKFRGKSLDTGEWVHGHFIVTGKNVHMIVVDGCMHMVNPETVGQYTGLKDRNGTEIYERDTLAEGSIIDNPYMERVTVAWHPNGFWMGEYMGSWNDYIEAYLDWVVVVENIYETPCKTPSND